MSGLLLQHPVPGLCLESWSKLFCSRHGTNPLRTLCKGQTPAMDSSVWSLITDLSRAITEQQRAVDDQEEWVQFVKQADHFVDLKQLSGATMQAETDQLGASHALLDDLHAQLGQAIDVWSQLTSDEEDQEEELRWTQFPDRPSPQPVSEEQSHSRARNNNLNPPSLYDPMVGSQVRHIRQWRNWTTAPTIHNPSTLTTSQVTPGAPPEATKWWWMQYKNHYGLCQPGEQGQLESSATAARRNRACASAPESTSAVHQPVSQEVRLAQHHRFHPSALPPLSPPVSGTHLPHSRRARRCSADFWLDDDFDPDFWQKNLRPHFWQENAWTDPPRYPIPEDDHLSPRTVPMSLRRG